MTLTKEKIIYLLIEADLIYEEIDNGVSKFYASNKEDFNLSGMVDEFADMVIKESLT